MAEMYSSRGYELFATVLDDPFNQWNRGLFADYVEDTQIGMPPIHYKGTGIDHSRYEFVDDDGDNLYDYVKCEMADWFGTPCVKCLGSGRVSSG